MVMRPTYINLTILAVTAFLSISGGAQASCDKDGGWAKPLHDLMAHHNDVIAIAHSLYSSYLGQKQGPSTMTTKDYIASLKHLGKLARKFMDANVVEPESTSDCLRMIAQLSQPRGLYWISFARGSVYLQELYQSRFHVLQRRIREEIKDFVNHQSTKDFVLPIEKICNGIPSSNFQKQISIKDVCSDVNTCASEDYPYTKQPILILEAPFTKACTIAKKCNVTEAITFMNGISWLAMSDWMVEKVCPDTCEGAPCNYEKTFEKVIHENNLLMAYVNIDPLVWNSTWKSFFSDVLVNDAFLNLEEIVSMVDEKVSAFQTTPTACSDLNFRNACIYADIYKEYSGIKKVQLYRKQPGFIRDFRHFPNMDFKRRLEQEKDTLKHLKLLGNINKLNENLEASVSGISTYFKQLAKYDEGIADADIAFIEGELTKYDKNMTDVQTKLSKSLKTLLKEAAILTAGNAAEKATLLALKVSENSNPLKLIFSSPDLTDIAALSGDVADAASDVAKSSALLVNLDALVQDSINLGKTFHENSKQLSGLKDILTKIKDGSYSDDVDDIDKDANMFLEAYAGYTPKTDRSALEKNNALWSAFGDSACELLSGDVGVAGSIPKGVVAANLLCETWQGTLAQFFTLREDIFDFQFQLVDAVAAVVRGNIAKRLAGGIKGKGDKLHASELLLGSFKMHNKFQSTASLACDILEYQLQGEQDRKACATTNGLFTEENFDELIVREFTADTTFAQKDVYIPTQPSFKGDTGYIDLQAMAKGEPIVFKLPANRKWLIKNGWITSDYTKMPFVKEIELFLPQKEYKTGADRQQTTTTIKISSTAGSRVSLSTSKKNIAYILPNRHSVYKTEYKEGYTTCSATEINNPYSLCGNLPKICKITSRIQGSLKLYPTILSTWRLSYIIEQGVQQFKWDAPKPATNFLIHASVKLIPSIQLQKDVPKIIKRSEVVASKNGCCDGNRYRISRFNNKCARCPAKSQSKLRGYYCELNEESRADLGKQMMKKSKKTVSSEPI